MQAAQAGLSMVSELYTLGTTIHNQIHSQQVISKLYGYLFADQSSDGKDFELGLKVGIIVGTRGQKEDKFADAIRIAKVLDVRHFIQQLIASKITEMVQEFLKAVSAELMNLKVKYPGISSSGTTINEINEILTKGVLRPLCLVFHATNADQPRTNAQGQILPPGAHALGLAASNSAVPTFAAPDSAALAFGLVDIGSTSPGSIPHGLPSDAAPGSTPGDSAPPGSGHRGSAPHGSAPHGSAPSDSAPPGSVDINKPHICPSYCLLKHPPPDHDYIPRPHTIQFYHPSQLRAFRLSNK